jgi:hypothetical protein
LAALGFHFRSQGGLCHTAVGDIKAVPAEIGPLAYDQKMKRVKEANKIAKLSMKALTS